MAEKPECWISLLPVGTFTESSPLKGCSVGNIFPPLLFSMIVIYLYSHGPVVAVPRVPVPVKDYHNVVRGQPCLGLVMNTVKQVPARK